jgi:hypothetical protein
MAEPEDQESEVAGSGEDRVSGVAGGSGKVVAVHPMLVLEMADHQLDRGAAPEGTLDGLAENAFLTCDIDLELSP